MNGFGKVKFNDQEVDKVKLNGEVVWQQLSTPVIDVNCLTFESDTVFTLHVTTPNWNNALYYSTDTTTWIEWDGASITSNTNGILYLRGEGNNIIGGKDSTNNRFQFTNANNLKCIGKISTLLDWEVVRDGGEPQMAGNCYMYLFYECISLIQAPTHTAIALSVSCYSSMYAKSGLTHAPLLPATTLSNYCYFAMVEDCAGIKVSSTYDAVNYPYEWRFPTTGTIDSAATGWSNRMLTRTGGSLTSNPSINTTYYTQHEPI